MITLFVDTNILLSFYHLTSEDIEELKKLVALIEKDEIELVLTEQVIDEFNRNRGSKIADAIKKLREARFNHSFPALSKDYDEYEELRELLKQAETKHSELVKKIEDDASNEELGADSIIDELFDAANCIEVTEEVQASAVRRVQRGNPPGKEGKLGDAINWECLLSYIESKSDLHFVSGDKDYESQLTTGALNEFLVDEWLEEKKSNLYFYKKISDFFKDNFPKIKIASEVEKDLLIEKLSRSGSFASTHISIAQLSKYSDFTIEQVELLAEIPQANSQVGWINSDTDVHEFYSALLEKYAGKISKEAEKLLREIVD